MKMSLELHDELKTAYRIPWEVWEERLALEEIGDYDDGELMFDWRDPEEGCR